MNQNFKKGILWGLGALVSLSVLILGLGIVMWTMDEESPWERDWHLAEQKALKIKSYTTRILNDPTRKSELIISGELEGQFNTAYPDSENHLAIAAIVRNHAGVVLTDCQDYIKYSKYELLGTKSFVLKCVPPKTTNDIGAVEFVIKHAWR